jgi:hypothetical protein
LPQLFLPSLSLCSPLPAVSSRFDHQAVATTPDAAAVAASDHDHPTLPGRVSQPPYPSPPLALTLILALTLAPTLARPLGPTTLTVPSPPTGTPPPSASRYKASRFKASRSLAWPCPPMRWQSRAPCLAIRRPRARRRAIRPPRCAARPLCPPRPLHPPPLHPLLLSNRNAGAIAAHTRLCSASLASIRLHSRSLLRASARRTLLYTLHLCTSVSAHPVHPAHSAHSAHSAHVCTFAHRCTPAPLRLCTPAPLHPCTPAPAPPCRAT